MRKEKYCSVKKKECKFVTEYSQGKHCQMQAFKVGMPSLLKEMKKCPLEEG
uniref:Uncharacterized protein n=1 Tax=viral metagenome TaxID=1070528 RepID=A0A6H1Z9W3_9ZZZZ